MADDKPKPERKQWELIQAKTFTKWCNMYLKRKNYPIIQGELNEAFTNGIRLMQLINALYDVGMPKKYNSVKKCKKGRPMRMDNVSVALSMLHDKAQVKTNNLKIVNVLDGDWTMMLGMIWAIILDFNIKGLEEGDNKNFKEGLLIWCRKKCEGYGGLDGKPKNFKKDFKNGKVFSALVNKHYPELLEYDEKEDPAERCKKAFDVAETLGIERLLDVDDIVNVATPDEKSVMTYVGEMYKVFSRGDMKEKAVEHVKKFLEFMRNIRQLQSDYETRAEAWSKSCENQVKEFEEAKEADTLTTATEALNAYKQYVLNTQPKMIAEKIELEELYTNIQSQLKVNKRVAYSTEITPKVLEDTYEKLNKAQNDHYLKARDTRFKFVEAIKPAEISKDQLSEWNDAFDHFDENKNDYLEFDEFSAALKAVGVPLTEDEEKKKFDELARKVKPDDAVVAIKCVNREKFIGFLENMYTAKDTPQSVIASMDNITKSGAMDLAALKGRLDEDEMKFIEENCSKNDDGSYDFATFVKSQFASEA